MSDEEVDLSIVMPTRNEEAAIGQAIETSRRAFSGLRLEVIVSDSSTDSTPEIARSLGATVVNPPELGYGAAYIYGFRHARGRLMGMADPDGTYDLGELPALLEPLENGSADLVIGSRLKGNIEAGAMPGFKRYFGNPLLTWLLNILFDVGVTDAHCGMRAFTRDAVMAMELRSRGMEFASEMLVEAKRKGLKIKEVPISYHKRLGSPSKLKSLGDGWRHIRYMLLARVGRA